MRFVFPLLEEAGESESRGGASLRLRERKGGNRAAPPGGDLLRGFARMLRLMYLCDELNITRYEIETNGCDAGASLSVDGRKGTRGAEADCGNLYGRNEQGDLFLSVR